ncbi:hypothetical protein [Vibrio diabolicus]|uniref:hypothetical protein n=1 Tax=Vibrio diabolicus TaxID=50719 RepID=UPI00080F41E1|nr:hypothetical protein [Vibrio diabolicus]MCS0318717.1 hypothetical protein [Vibrio diabolicus]OCH71741.1 hypothetical protein A6E00_18070 [Vibrio diabolicus]
MTIPVNMSPDEDYIKIKGNLINNGSSRDVYEVLNHSEYVLKYNEKAGANRNEEKYYSDAKQLNLSDVIDRIGTISSISKSGKYLIMERLDDLVNFNGEYEYPDEIQDVKKSSFGQNSAGEVKLRDYALQKPNHTGPSGRVNTLTRTNIDQMNDWKDLLD